MGEAKVKAEQEQMSLLAMVSLPVTVDDILVGAAAIGVLGDFWPRTGINPETGQPHPPPDAQLQRYWGFMRRCLSVEKVPAVWNRIRCLTEAMAANSDILKAIGGEERADGGVFYDIQSPLFRRVAATMPIMPNRAEGRSTTASVWCPHEVILSLVKGPT